MKWLLCVAGLLIASPAMGQTGDVLVVATDDPELSRAIVHAASQQFSGPVALAPGDWSGPVSRGTLRLRVVARAGAWHVVLAGPVASVSRELHVSSSIRLDVAEAIGLALPGMEDRLAARTEAVVAARAERQRRKEREEAVLLAQRRLESVPPPPVVHAAPVRPPPSPSSPVRLPPPVHHPPPVARPLPKASHRPARLARVPVIPAVESRPPLPPAPAIAVPSASAGLSLDAGLLSANRLTAFGGDASAQAAFLGPWIGRFSIGAYEGQALQKPLWIIPIDILFGARLSAGRVHLGVALGGELNIASAPVETGLVTAFVGQFTATVHVTEAWSVGLRFSTALSTDSSESNETSPGDVYIPQAQFRIGLIGLWESSE